MRTIAPAHQEKLARPLPSSPPSFAWCEGGSEESELSLARPSIYLRQGEEIAETSAIKR
jgi:hypothetical protein